MGSVQPGLIEGSARSRQTKPGIGHAVPGQYVFRRMDTLQKSYLKTLIAQIFSPRNRTRWPRNGQGPPVCLSLGHSALLGHQMDQMLSSTGGSTLVKPVMVPRSDSAVIDSSLVNSAEQRPPLASEGLLVASPTQNVESIFVAPRQEPLQLPVKVANTIAEVRAQSTRCLYPIKTSLSSPTGVPFEMKTHPLVR